MVDYEVLACLKQTGYE